MSIKRKFSLIVLTFLTPLVLLAAFNNQCFADDTDSNDSNFLQFDDSDDNSSDPFSLFFGQAPSYVLDKAGIINDNTQDYVSNVNDNVLSKVKGKPIIAVITSKDCHGEDIADYSQKMFDKYHFGKGKLNNGVLIVINKEDYQVRVQTGYGMESILPDAYLNKTIVKAFTKETKSRIIKKGTGQSGGGGASATVNVAGEELVHHKTYSQGTKELVNLIAHRITNKLPTQTNKDSKSKLDKADVTFDELSDTVAEICLISVALLLPIMLLAMVSRL